jgi:hypothetical protein
VLRRGLGSHFGAALSVQRPETDVTDVIAQGTGEKGTPNYWTRKHAETVVLDIGGDVGALVVYTPAEFHGREIEISPIGQATQRVHTAVLERVVDGRGIFAAVYPHLPAGVFRLWIDDGPARATRVEIIAGQVAELDWR